jgi:hypothetical protein
MHSPIDNLIREHFNDPQLIKQATLQRLWSDYGEIARYYSPKLARTMIVKHVAPPSDVHHPRGWHSNVGHQRKVHSYRVEAAFYQSYSMCCDDTCYVPQFISLVKNSHQSEQQTLILEDLEATGFNKVYRTLNVSQIKAVLSWLAHFHGRFLAIDTSGLWPIGTYWHFGTRQAEYQVMPNSGLKENALLIANTLENVRFKTLLHGDAKVANFCFSQSDSVAAVDFQYVGRGVGVKDLMYFLGSCLNDQQLCAQHNDYVNYYFEILKNVLCQQSNASYTDKITTVQKSDTIDLWFIELEREWRALIPFAWADFNRFLQGWSMEHPKINDFMYAQTERVLTTLKKQKGLTPEK